MFTNFERYMTNHAAFFYNAQGNAVQLSQIKKCSRVKETVLISTRAIQQGWEKRKHVMVRMIFMSKTICMPRGSP